MYFFNRYLKSLKFIFGVIYFKKHYTNDDAILTLQQYYNEILILQQHFIHNVLNGHYWKVPAIFQKLFLQLYKYCCNIARFQRNTFEIFRQYYGAMWVVPITKNTKSTHFQIYLLHASIIILQNVYPEQDITLYIALRASCVTNNRWNSFR